MVSTTIVFFAPLVYKTNQELIDHHVKNASDMVNAQTAQFREVAGRHTSHATELTKQYMGDYTAKAQEMLRGNKGAASPEAVASSKPAVKESDFPAAPKEDLQSAASAAPLKTEEAEKEPLIAA